ncbi:Hypothetical predicted protein, partial [Mytilus galloprovincialis]
TSCPSSSTDRVCDNVGSSLKLTFIFDLPVQHSTIEFHYYKKSNSRTFINITINADIYIKNVTHEDEGFYELELNFFREIQLKVANLRFMNQTDPNTMVGQEGNEIEIKCSSDTEQYIDALKIESNGSIVAMGDNQSVSYSFIPKRTDHLTSYTCVDITHSSIMIEVKLNINCSPIFAKENRAVKIGKVGQPIILTFLVYSYPNVEEIFLGPAQSIKRKVTKFNVLNTTLLYTEFDNKVGIQGYEISIESPKLNLEDFQAYCITVKNRLGSSDYHFEIIKKEDITTTHRKQTYVVILFVVSTILFGYMIIRHVYLCVEHKRTLAQGDHNVNQNFHSYADIESVSYNTVSSVHSPNTIVNHVSNPTLTRAQYTSHRRSTDDNTFEDNEVHAYLDIDLPLPDVGEIQVIASAYSDTNVLDIDVSRILPTLTEITDNVLNYYQGDANINKDTPSYQSTKASNDSDSDSSGYSMIGSVGDGYENPYESISQERPESHQYIEMIVERHCSVLSSESNSE